MKTFLKEKVGIFALVWLAFAVGIAAASSAGASQRDGEDDHAGVAPADAALVHQVVEQQLLEVHTEQRTALHNSLLEDLELAAQTQSAIMDLE